MAVTKKTTPAAAAKKSPAKKKEDLPEIIEQPTLDISTLEPEQLKEVKGLEEKQLRIVAENPFVAITDNKSLEKAKTHRLALLTASTTVEKQDGAIASFLTAFRKRIGTILTAQAGVTRDAYDKQDAEVKRYEKVKQDAKDEADRQAKAREDGIRATIEEVVKEMNGLVDEMAYITIDHTVEKIQKLRSLHSGTFEEFNILFNREVEVVDEKIEAKIAAVTKAYDDAEADRKSGHTSKIDDMDLAVKTIILKMDSDNYLESYDEADKLLKSDHDFEEYKATFDTKVADLRATLNKTLEKLKTEAADRTAQAEKDRELAELRLDKLYRDRSEILIGIGMEKTDLGGFVVYDLDYLKVHVLTDNDEAFNQTVENIKKFIEIESGKPKPSFEEVRDEALEIAAQSEDQTPQPIVGDGIPPVETDEPHNEPDFGSAQHRLSGARNIIDNPDDDDEEETAEAKFTMPATIGQLKTMLSQFDDSWPINNLFNVNLYEVKAGDKIVIDLK